ncbi:hypothetical protein PBY51_014524 [Eleginops maclovinus]|nr:hypothetical protein PBY51_014524 [Eleginops maclovinus]
MESDNINRIMWEFSRVNEVTTGWIVDFLFVSLCRRFKEGKLEEFNAIVQILEAIADSPVKEPHEDKTMVCAFLSRVMHGQQLDIVFDLDEDMMPLMCAAKIWPKLECTVADKSLFKEILNLLFVQSVCVCLEKGKTSPASFALKWFKKQFDFPQYLKARVSSMVQQKETQKLHCCSFSRLREAVQTYLDAYLKKNPSDYLLKEATKMLQASSKGGESQDVVAQDVVAQDVVAEDVVAKDVVAKDVVAQDVVAQDVVAQEVVAKDVVTQDVVAKDVVTQDVVAKDVVTQDVVAQGKETQGKEMQGKETQGNVSKEKHNQTTTNKKLKRKLFSTNFMEDWKIDSGKKCFVSMKKISENKLSQVTHEKSMETSQILKTRKTPQKWNSKLDHYLRKGVQRHGTGRWAKMLLDYDFEGRTGTMLKDRWRTLMKSHKVG